MHRALFIYTAIGAALGAWAGLDMGIRWYYAVPLVIAAAAGGAKIGLFLTALHYPEIFSDRDR